MSVEQKQAAPQRKQRGQGVCPARASQLHGKSTACSASPNPKSRCSLESALADAQHAATMQHEGRGAADLCTFLTASGASSTCKRNMVLNVLDNAEVQSIEEAVEGMA